MAVFICTNLIGSINHILQLGQLISKNLKKHMMYSYKSFKLLVSKKICFSFIIAKENYNDFNTKHNFKKINTTLKK